MTTVSAGDGHSLESAIGREIIDAHVAASAIDGGDDLVGDAPS